MRTIDLGFLVWSFIRRFAGGGTASMRSPAAWSPRTSTRWLCSR